MTNIVIVEKLIENSESCINQLLESLFKLTSADLKNFAEFDKQTQKFCKSISDDEKDEFMFFTLIEELRSSFKIEGIDIDCSYLQQSIQRIFRNSFNLRSISISKDLNIDKSKEYNAALSLEYVLTDQSLSVSNLEQTSRLLQATNKTNLRKFDVGVKNDATSEIVYTAPSFKNIEKYLTEFFDFIEHHKSSLPFSALSALTHLIVVLIHPFEDGNGRVSRLFSLKFPHLLNQIICFAPSAIFLQHKVYYYKILQQIQIDRSLSNALKIYCDFQELSLNKSKRQHTRLKALNKFLESSTTVTYTEFERFLLKFLIFSFDNQPVLLSEVEKHFSSNTFEVVQSFEKFIEFSLIQDGRLNI